MEQYGWTLTEVRTGTDLRKLFGS
ncbi:TPA: hypothetical protein ACYX7M_002463 [Staphylococcus aureus]